MLTLYKQKKMKKFDKYTRNSKMVKKGFIDTRVNYFTKIESNKKKKKKYYALFMSIIEYQFIILDFIKPCKAEPFELDYITHFQVLAVLFTKPFCD